MMTLMVHIESGHSNAKLLRLVADLSSRLDADVLGIAACRPPQAIYDAGYLGSDVLEQDRVMLEKELEQAEAEFRTALQGHRGNLEWCSTMTSMHLAEYLAGEARRADLLITSVDRNRVAIDSLRHVNLGDLIMQLGRPALIVPSHVEKLSFERVLIGWKDTRESRRVVLDALPLLRKADHVVICAIAPAGEIATARTHLADVVGWLERNGIVAEPIVSLPTAADATQLDEIASDKSADMIVAGAYGHSRLREWALGGVTKDLLLRADRCSFVSH